MGNSKIEWTEKTWNPVTGCSKVSPGCKNCYAERIFPRVYDRPFTDVQIHPERLDHPKLWRKPAMIFVNSMSDLFHESVPDSFIRDVFWTMQCCGWHTFQILTKRPGRMYDFLKDAPVLPNVWLGTSIENQEMMLERLEILVKIDAAVRFLSFEPLLEKIYFKRYDLVYEKINWVICGGESGPRARPMKTEWALALKNQCEEAGIPFFFKQGSQASWPRFKDFDSFPEELQVRQYPE